MIKNYLKITLRYLLNNKSYTIINMSGLAIGIACCILIMLFVKSEFSYDKFHTKADRIYRAWLHEKYDGQEFINTLTPIPLGNVLSSAIPEIESSCRVYIFNTLVQFNGAKFNESVNMVDTNFFNLFDFGLIDGDPKTAFTNSHSIIISEQLAKKYFGKEKAIGKVLELQLDKEKVLFTVTTVSNKMPQESSIKFDLLIPHSNDHYLFNEKVRTRAWSDVFEETYILLKNGKTSKDVEQKIPDLTKSILGNKYKPGQYNVHLQPIADIHLNKSLPAGNLPISDPIYSYILGAIGILILLIACINFVALSVGRSVTRAIEVSVRKVLGAERRQLIYQFWGESILLTFISLITALGLSFLFLKPFNSLANRELALSFDGSTILFFFALVALIGLGAGIYPAIVLSSFNPIRVMKNHLYEAVSIGLFLKALITVQFTASIILIISAFEIGQQLNYLQNKNLGYDKERLLIVSTNKPRSEAIPLAEKFKTELNKNTQALGSSISLFSFSEPGWVNLGYDDDNKRYRNFRMNAVGADFIKNMKLQLITGRDFSDGNAVDLNNSMIVNEAMVKEYGWKEPIGQKLPGKFPQTVIGVVKDFHFESLHNKIQPLALVIQPDSMTRNANDMAFVAAPQPRITIRLKEGNLQDQIESIKKDWQAVAGSQDFEYKFLDESLNDQYKSERRLSSMVFLASILSIFIACMGLFGLTTLAVTRRTKEIGIRKTLGADIKSILFLLSKDFIWLVSIAALIAFPIAWWALSQWLQEFVYRVSIRWWVFIATGLATLIIALITLSLQGVKAAAANPVKSLRTE